MDELEPLPARHKEERFYLTDAESDALRRAAYAKRISKSEYVRRLVVERAKRDAGRLGTSAAA